METTESWYYLTLVLDGTKYANTTTNTWRFGASGYPMGSGITKESPLIIGGGTYDIWLEIRRYEGLEGAPAGWQFNEDWQFTVPRPRDQEPENYLDPQFYSRSDRIPDEAGVPKMHPVMLAIEVQNFHREIRGPLVQWYGREQEDPANRLHLGVHTLTEQNKLINIKADITLFMGSNRQDYVKIPLGIRKLHYWINVWGLGSQQQS